MPHKYLTLSFATLDKHKASGSIDQQAALRLLRRNARDIAPRASYLQSQSIARRLLQSWNNGDTPAIALSRIIEE